MPKFRELKFVIEGEIDGHKITPLNLPMARLAEYLTELATLYGYKDYVHFLRVDEGSAAPVVLIDEEEEVRILERVRKSPTVEGEPAAHRAYEALNHKLIEDNAVARIADFKGAKILAFPGKETAIPKVYGPFSEQGFVDGEIVRVGGKDETIPIWLRRADGRMFYCETTNRQIAEELAKLLYRTIRAFGYGTWLRNENEEWVLQKFVIKTWEGPLHLDDLSVIVAHLRAIDGGWKDVDDPFKELERIRHGEEEPKQ